MSDVQVKFKRGNTATLNNTPITDGMIYFDTENKHIYMDNDETRIEYSNDMSNFMDKTIIENLVDKHDYNYLVSPQKMNNVIGDFPIEGDILSAISALKYISEAFVFKTVWQDDAHQPYYDKWIDIDDSYQFFIISFGSYETGIFNNNIDLNSWKCNDDNFNNLSKYFNIVINNTVSYCFSEDSYVYNPISIPVEPVTPPNDYSKIYGGYPSLTSGLISDYKKNTRQIRVNYISSINKTSIYLGAYNDYLGGSEYSVYPSTWVCGKYIPYKIVGVGRYI